MASQYEKRKTKKLGETSAPESNAETTTPVVNYDRVGYDIFRDESTGKFVKVALEYDLTSGNARVKEITPVADSLPRAVQESQKLFVNKLMGIKGE